MKQLIVKQTGEVVGTVQAKSLPPFMKTWGRVLSEHPQHGLMTVFDPDYQIIEVRGKRVKRTSR